MNVICHSVNVDGVVVLHGGGEDTLTLHTLNLLKLITLKDGGDQKPSFQLPLHPGWWRHLNPTCCYQTCTLIPSCPAFMPLCLCALLSLCHSALHPCALLPSHTCTLLPSHPPTVAPLHLYALVQPQMVSDWPEPALDHGLGPHLKAVALDCIWWLWPWNAFKDHGPFIPNKPWVVAGCPHTWVWGLASSHRCALPPRHEASHPYTSPHALVPSHLRPLYPHILKPLCPLKLSSSFSCSFVPLDGLSLGPHLRAVPLDCIWGLQPWTASEDCSLGLHLRTAALDCIWGLWPWTASAFISSKPGPQTLGDGWLPSHLGVKPCGLIPRCPCALQPRCEALHPGMRPCAWAWNLAPS